MRPFPGRRIGRSFTGPRLGARLLAKVDQDIRALEMRREGLDYKTIGENLGMTAGSASAAVRRALALSIAETSDEVREIEIQRLESYIPHALKVLNGRHLVVNQGRVICDPDTDEPLIDPEPSMKALDRLLKISEAIREFRGLNAPKRSISEVITVDAIQAEILRLRAVVAAQAGTGERPAFGPGSADSTVTDGGGVSAEPSAPGGGLEAVLPR